MRPQAPFKHENVREIIEDVTQSSAMRLDPVSMEKLWDLISMVFKWQVSMSDNLMEITHRHLYEIENYVINPDTHQQLQRVQNIIENFNKVLDKKEKMALHRDVLYWLRDFNVRVSLLLRMGLQNMDGNFVVNGLDPVAEEMLKNLGENIYQVTQNGRILENRCNLSKPTEQEPVGELQLFVNEILGDRKLSSSSTEGNSSCFKLSINDENANRSKKNQVAFDNIDININSSKLQDLMNDMSLKNEENGDTFRDDLLNMLENNYDKN